MTGMGYGIKERMHAAHDNFASLLREQAPSLSKHDSERLANYYVAKRLAKLDPVMGRITVKHGAYWEPDVILKAFDMMQQEA